MIETNLLIITSFIGFFLSLTSLLQTLSTRFQFPYTILLLISGFVLKSITTAIGYNIPITISTEFIYYIILPLLLFESAYNVNFHQFRRQFKTITFLATFGVMISIFIISVSLPVLIGLPLPVALLFGALISATDPIAVLALFKSLGAPKRLQLLADGESMFNDATAVILFRLIASFVIADQTVDSVTIITGIGSFVYVFIGSIIFGGLFGYIISKFIQQIQNDRFVETTLTITLAISSFIVAEHAFGLSGVIATVASGIILGNLGKTKISGGVAKFMRELWEYVSFICISLVFFFAAITIDLNLLLQNPIKSLTIILVVLLARAISIYLSFYITNNSKIFNTEPNTPLQWQHILNWGGLRGVIPLVLVYSLPDAFEYKQYLLIATLGTLLFSLFVNGLTIKWLLVKLKLHIPKKEDQILKEESQLFTIEQHKQNLKTLKPSLIQNTALKQIRQEIQDQQTQHKKQLLKLATVKELTSSLKHQALTIERQSLDYLYNHNVLTEHSYFKIDNQLNELEDALKYPTLFDKNKLTQIYNRQNENQPLNTSKALNWVQRIIGETKIKQIKYRINELKVKTTTYDNVLDYLDHVKKYIKDKPSALKAIKQVKQEYQTYYKNTTKQLSQLENQFPEIVEEYQKKLIKALIIKE